MHTNNYHLRYFNLLDINIKKLHIITFSLRFYLLLASAFLLAKELQVKLLTAGSDGRSIIDAA